jgi:hypothetical protein
MHVNLSILAANGRIGLSQPDATPPEPSFDGLSFEFVDSDKMRS